jgi:hypothetical protein
MPCSVVTIRDWWGCGSVSLAGCELGSIEMSANQDKLQPHKSKEVVQCNDGISRY